MTPIPLDFGYQAKSDPVTPSFTHMYWKHPGCRCPLHGVMPRIPEQWQGCFHQWLGNFQLFTFQCKPQWDCSKASGLLDTEWEEIWLVVYAMIKVCQKHPRSSVAACAAVWAPVWPLITRVWTHHGSHTYHAFVWHAGCSLPWRNTTINNTHMSIFCNIQN